MRRKINNKEELWISNISIYKCWATFYNVLELREFFFILLKMVNEIVIYFFKVFHIKIVDRILNIYIFLDPNEDKWYWVLWMLWQPRVLWVRGKPSMTTIMVGRQQKVIPKVKINVLMENTKVKVTSNLLIFHMIYKAKFESATYILFLFLFCPTTLSY